MRIRAAGLTDTIREKEITLDHVSGKVLIADGLTKQLAGPALGRFKRALQISGGEKEAIEVKKIEFKRAIEPGFTRGVGLLVAAASLLGRVEAAKEEVTETTGEWWIPCTDHGSHRHPCGHHLPSWNLWNSTTVQA